jgi:uncharacterized protein YxeA
VKVYKKLIITIIVIIVIIIIIGGLYTINEYRYDQLEKLIYEAELRKNNEVEQKEKIKFEAEQKKREEIEQKERLEYSDDERKKLQNVADQKAKLQYELMLQTIEENSDFYVSFSKKSLTEFYKYGYDYNYDNNGFFILGYIKEKLENEFNSDLLVNINSSYIVNEEGIIFVMLQYPFRIMKDYYYSSGSVEQYSFDYSIIYIPDEYLNAESIAKLSSEFYGFTDENLEDNLYIAKNSSWNYK